MKKIIIIGATGGAADVCSILRDINKHNMEYEILGFLDDNSYFWNKVVYGIKVLGGTEQIKNYPQEVFFISAIGSQLNFKKKPEIIKSWGIEKKRFAKIIHPSSVISEFTDIGYGAVINPNVTIGPSAKIGNFVQILPNTNISHHVVIKDYSIINGSCLLAGSVEIGENCYIGSSTSIRQNVKVGSKVLVGMGSIVLNDIKSEKIGWGTPFRLKNWINND